jgi:trehalose 6-phosphate synthase
MRLSTRLILSLVSGVAVVSLGLALYQAQAERRGSRRELERRARVMAESLEKSATPLLEASSTSTLQRLVVQFRDHERLAGVAVYDAQGKPLAATAGVEEMRAAGDGAWQRALQPGGGGEAFFPWNGKSMHIVARPIASEAGPAATLAIFQDAGYIDAAESALWRRAFAGVVVQTLMIVGATLLFLRWSLRRPLAHLEKWLGDLRRGAAPEAPDLPEEADFAPLKREAARLATTLTAARAAAEEEARLRDAGESQWTEERLRAFIQTRLRGSSLFVVSNREPYEHVRRGRSVECSVPASGLVTALEPILCAANGMWIAQGTGSADRETVDEDAHVRVPPEHPQYTLRRVWVTEEEEKGFYFGFANEGIWPLCHIAHTRPVFRSQDWELYRAVNRRFADALLEEIAGERNPVVLVQDYHFALLPRMIKAARPDARVALFWHIPWPNPEAFGICPWQGELLDGLLGADLLGFHVQAHCNNFLDTVDRLLESRIDRERFAVNRCGRFTYVRPLPISVPFGAEAAGLAPGESVYLERVEALRAAGVEASMLGVGVDRIDYTKGIPERFRAIETLFENYPAYLGRFTLVQIGAPSRTHIKRYHDLLEEVTLEAERINRRFQAEGWKPIVFLPRHHSHRQILPYYRAADLCLVTSLHDGMNLVAKEFVAARCDGQGVLILSRFAGASHELADALLVNPYDTEGLADTIHRALAMPREERRARMTRMRTQVREHNVYRWAASLIAELEAIRLDAPADSGRREPLLPVLPELTTLAAES